MKIDVNKLFNPLFYQVEWKPKEKTKYIVASIAIGIISMGLAHGTYAFVHGLLFLKNRLVKILSYNESPKPEDLFRDIVMNNKRKSFFPDFYFPKSPSPPKKKEGIHTGLPNLGNTCWFNSMVKMLATTSAYDDLYQHKDSDSKEQKIVRQKLGGLVSELRQSNKKCIDLKYYREIFSTIIQSVSAIRAEGQEKSEEKKQQYIQDFYYHQNDPGEFLQILFDILNHQSKDTLSWTCVYKDQLTPVSGTTEKPIAGDSIYEIFVDRSLHFGEKAKPIDFAAAASNGLARSNTIRNKEGNVVHDEEYQKKYLTLPKSLKVKLHRVINSLEMNPEKNEDQFVQLKSSSNLNLNKKGQIKMMRYVGMDEKGKLLSTDSESIVSLIPKDVYKYKVTNAILHSGSGSGGHYTYLERKGNNFLFHDDRSITKISIQAALDKIAKNGVFFSLELESIVPIHKP